MTRSIATNLKINLGAMVCACLALTTALAVSVNLNVDENFPPGPTPHVLGNVNPPEPGGADNDAAYINGMIGLPLGGSTTVGGNTVYRSGNFFGSLPIAITAGDMSGDTSSLVLPTGFEYLVGEYDSGGLEVWAIGSISAGSTIDIQESAFGSNNDDFDLSEWWLFNSQTNGEIPDGGSTAMLFGCGFLGICLIRSYLSRHGRARTGHAAEDETHRR